MLKSSNAPSDREPIPAERHPALAHLQLQDIAAKLRAAIVFSPTLQPSPLPCISHNVESTNISTRQTGHRLRRKSSNPHQTTPQDQLQEIPPFQSLRSIANKIPDPLSQGQTPRQQNPHRDRNLGRQAQHEPLRRAQHRRSGAAARAQN